MSYKNNKKTVVALSGGVDSTTTALLLIKEGYEVSGITGIMHDGMEEAARNASEACKVIGIEHHILDLREEFNKTVINYFENNYKKGLTPNPCTYCNRYIKWGSLADYAFEKLNADFYATGHYARILKQNDSFCLYRGEDHKKDQSYMLFALTQKQLSRTLFPLGNINKTEVKEIALDNQLISADSRESQDVCFICPPETTQSYLISKFGEKEGEIIDYKTGKVLGIHKGAFNFTTGQRKGIGVAASAPLYVISTDPDENKIYVGFKELLFSQEFDVENVNWQQEKYGEKQDNELQKLPSKQSSASAFYTPASQHEFPAMVKIRYNSEAQEAIITKTDENSVHVKLKEPKSAITPGQAAVFYDMNNEFVLCGGWIK
ncbi:MAG: tRNA 2-thiouridine(34) synthase MnmA [Candidatus Melainabacteria bacterium GWF2_32_7]|nr:MAG: tRNA 2-thiouridine(34) synthase MnmA [Candidatus Melainabacteria bacterium GWF2_32_7]